VRRAIAQPALGFEPVKKHKNFTAQASNTQRAQRQPFESRLVSDITVRSLRSLRLHGQVFSHLLLHRAAGTPSCSTDATVSRSFPGFAPHVARIFNPPLEFVHLGKGRSIIFQSDEALKARPHTSLG
jgi:hypothetical protein